MEYALAEGVVSSSPDGLYHREEWIDRGQAAVLIARFAAGGDSRIPEGPDTPAFPDVTPHPDDPYSYCYRHVEHLVSRRIIPAPPASRS